MVKRKTFALLGSEFSPPGVTALVIAEAKEKLVGLRVSQTLTKPLASVIQDGGPLGLEN